MSRRAGAVSEETKTVLIQAAVKEFSTLGFDNASLRLICEHAGLTTGALYFFFKNKEDLFEEILNSVTQPLLEVFECHCQLDVSNPIEVILGSEQEDYEVLESILHLYYQNKDMMDVIFNNRTHPKVIQFFNQIVDMSTKFYIDLVEMMERTYPEREPVDRFALHWFAHLEIDVIISIISHGFDEKEALQHARPIVKMLRQAFLSMF